MSLFLEGGNDKPVKKGRKAGHCSPCLGLSSVGPFEAEATGIDQKSMRLFST